MKEPPPGLHLPPPGLHLPPPGLHLPPLPRAPPRPCPYLPGRSMVVEGFHAERGPPAVHAALLAAGFRRFGRTYFRAACPECSECTPLRVLVREFRPSRSQRRVLRRNADVEVEVGEPAVDGERLELFARFHEERSARRGWPAQERDPDSYRESFLENAVETLELRYRLAGRLVALAYVDRSSCGLSSLYGMHDPAESRRCLGTFDVLTEIELARRLDAPYLYLGYRVRGCLSMEYKAAFHPHEVLEGGEWRLARSGG